MKKFFILAVIGMFSMTAFAGNESNEIESTTNVKELKVEKMAMKAAPVEVYCDGVYTGTIDCPSCSTTDLIEIAVAMCN